MKIQLDASPWYEAACDALVIPFFEDDDYQGGIASELDARTDGLLAELRATEEWKGKSGDVTVVYRPSGMSARRLILVGAGDRKDFDLTAIRERLMDAVHRVKGYDLKRVAFYRRSRIAAPLAAQAAVEGIILATYDGDDYKTEEKSKNFVGEISLLTTEEVDRDALATAFERGRILGEATNYARRLVNQPGNHINPPRLAEEARTAGERCGLEVEVLSEREMVEEGMHALLGVAKGSDEPAQFIILRHWGGPQDEPPVVLVGKGVTFDSGGLSLKPPEAMVDMKVDKAGACAVLAALQAIAQLGIKRNVVGLIPTVENMVSGRAQRPGDIVRSLSGKTIEVLNTDAEGRLILADALHYAHRLRPSMMLDIATLTGACVVALGHYRAGVFSNNDNVFARLMKASERSGEKLWRLPLDKEYRKLLDSDIADIKNVGGRWGGAVTAAKFLEEFVGETPWCHIDMAGVDSFPARSCMKGATGFGVRTMVELVSGIGEGE